MTLLLRVRPGAPQEPDLEHWQVVGPSRRQYLSAEEYMEMYGSTEEGLRAVIDFLESKGLSVVESSAGRRRVVAEGDAAKINAAFGSRSIGIACLKRLASDRAPAGIPLVLRARRRVNHHPWRT